MEKNVRLSAQANSKAEASRLTLELETFLRQRTEGIRIDRVRDNPDSQDAGTVLVAALATPAIVELAKGIADWMRKRNVSISISADGGQSYEGPPEQVERILRDVMRGSDAQKK